MASCTGAFLLSYLLAVSFTNEFSANVSSIDKLVDYEFKGFPPLLLPGIQYNSTIFVFWAVPSSALYGLEGRSVAVRVAAETGNNSSAYFLSPLGARENRAEIYLRCDVSNGTCANTSVLSGQIPVYASAGQGARAEAGFALRSEIAEEPNLPGIDIQAEGIWGSLAKLLSQNQSNQSNEAPSNGSAEFANFSGGAGDGGNILDGLRPEGDYHDPVQFLRSNPFISITALAIVVLITGAYLLNSKD